MLFRSLVWLNVHRFAAAIVALGVAGHVALHWRPFWKTLAKVVPGPKARRIGAEPLLYLVFAVAAVTGLVAWLVVEGSSPVLGPAILGRAGEARHPWIDVHHLTSLVALGLVAHHVWHRLRSLTRWPRVQGRLPTGARSGA